MSVEELAKTQEGIAVAAIIKDLEGRKGLGNEWDRIDDEVKREIFETWVHILLEKGP